MPETWDVEVFTRVTNTRSPVRSAHTATKFVAQGIEAAMALVEDALADENVGAVVAYRSTEGK